MPESGTFEPNWVSPPGDTIAELLAHRSLSLVDFAERIGTPVATADELARGLVQIDRPLAERLERALGPSATFWINREAQYRADIARLGSRATTAADKAWVQGLPTRDMVAFGWIRATETFAEKLAECLRFFAVPNVDAWHRQYGGAAAVAAFRMSSAFESRPGAVSTWLRWAEIVSGRAECRPWAPEKFRAKLDEIRRMTWVKDPAVFLPKLRKICADCGVAVVVARTPSGCPASGATRFLTPDKALMVLSFRYRTDDQFWFTFFHEAGHLLLHGKDALFLEDGSDVTSPEEAEANEFAARLLIPDALLTEFRALRPLPKDIFDFARRAEVAPGMIVGQLQHHNRLGKDRLNYLKRRYSWDAILSDSATP
ncbi:ImmA/IrrE family metallo-endopeptidase [Pseudoroseomonas cervicalis]|uniref:ImmA/IrrE family metallo-endopeptidase n=1 Tax=Teichococcus cervicalis TaxID=204525 RepID=UPI000590CF13|nr:ImmA/IrrE family metallo-endopeptidase [Pseudoroseomonas cervicalis]